MIENYNGIVEDTRTDENKAKDFIHEELFASAPAPKWEERESKKYPIFNQDGSSACVAFATAKILGIDEVVEGREFVALSPRDIYIRRDNKNNGGMFLPNALDIARKHGATLESLVPSENRNEADQNKTDGISFETDDIALKYKAAGFVSLPLNIDAIAAITSQGKGVLLGHRFDYSEWTDFPKVDVNSKLTCGHGTAAVDNILINGRKYIVMDDSWGPHQAKFGQRFLDEEWINTRLFYAGYTLNFIYEDQTNNNEKLHYVFHSFIKFGDKNADVVALQNILKYEGLFPKNVDSTGLYGPVTQKGVLLFQNKYLGTNNKGRQVGPQTLKKLNELYGKN